MILDFLTGFVEEWCEREKKEERQAHVLPETELFWPTIHALRR